jgi:hypothetical protein
VIENVFGTIWLIVLILLIWPAHSRAPDAFAPAKTGRDVLQPLRDIHCKFAPRDRRAFYAVRRALLAALLLPILLGILTLTVLSLSAGHLVNARVGGH